MTLLVGLPWEEVDVFGTPPTSSYSPTQTQLFEPRNSQLVGTKPKANLLSYMSLQAALEFFSDMSPPLLMHKASIAGKPSH